MKKFFIICCLLLGTVWCQAENKIQMVTYFPVPYVAYSQINPTKQLDVGLSSACEMNLGCQESGEAGLYPLQVTTELLLNKGRLDFNTAAAVYSASASQTDTDCWTEQIKWSGVKSETNSQAIFQCSQTNTYDPHRTCGVKCTGKATAKGESRCASLSGACYRVGEICMIQTTYCPVWTGSYTMSEPNCNCQGGAVLNKTYQECVRTYVKNGW